jgi:CDP-diacylglycerol--glycerol-3-phosphate 3-phosphatidyltransferase
MTSIIKNNYSNFRKNIPNTLTALRVILIPMVVFSFYIDSKISNALVATLFMIASITDFFDGYLARMMQVQSNFGRCLDPIADKLLIIVSLVMLINFSNGNFFILIPALIIICREVMVSGLREFLATIRSTLPVNKLGKWKTAIQMISITALLLAGNGSEYVFNEIMDFVEVRDYVRINLEGFIQIIGEVGLIVSAFLTILSGIVYFKAGIKNF